MAVCGGGRGEGRVVERNGRLKRTWSEVTAGRGHAVGEVSHEELKGRKAGWVWLDKTRRKVGNWRDSPAR